MAKAVESTLDDSYIGRQGIKMAWSHPSIWAKRSLDGLKGLVDTYRGKEVLDEVKAYIVSRPDYMNGNFKKMGLNVDNIEEVFQSKKLENLPGVGRIIKASDVAFTLQAYLSRVDAAEMLLKIARRNEGKPSLLYGKEGTDLNNKAQLESIGKLVNSMTGRGDLGKLEPAAPALNVAMFSARFLKSNIDTLTLHALDTNFSRFARVEAAKNLMKIITGTAAVLTLANTLVPGSVETDSRSADFGKIKIGKTRFDITGGMASLIVLASRLIEQETKSSTTGRVTKLNQGGFGSPTSATVLGDFLTNKLSPSILLGKQLLTGLDRNNKKITPGKAILNTYTPLPVTNYLELKNNPKSANILAAMISDLLGVGTNTY